MRSALIVLALLIASALAVAPRADDRAGPVDLEIVLAVDASGSVDATEFQLQLDGIAEAFRDAEIQNAILSGPNRRIAVALLIWADSAFPKVSTGWYTLASPASADAFADLVQTFRSKKGNTTGVGGGGTSIGDALAYAVAMLQENGISADRSVVDVSGDGIETDPWAAPAIMLPEARAMASARGITVNGLAILNDYEGLDLYYRDFLITGDGSFVMDAADYDDFKRAIREKLWREIVQFVG